MKTKRVRVAAALLISGLAASAGLAQSEAVTVKKEAVTTRLPAAQNQGQLSQRPPEVVEKIVGAMKEAEKAAIDKPAPNFKLVDTAGKEHLLSDYVAAGNVVVLEWFNPQCPYVVEHYNSEGKGTSTAVEKEFKETEQKVVWLRVNSGSAESGVSGKDYNNQFAKEWKITSPILLDLDGKVGKAYNAKVTPTLVVITADGIVAYEGLMDSEKSSSKTGEVIYPREAVKSVLAGETVETKQTKAVGCGIKYAAKTSD